jgi:hypothetical protein
MWRSHTDKAKVAENVRVIQRILEAFYLEVLQKVGLKWIREYHMLQQKGGTAMALSRIKAFYYCLTPLSSRVTPVHEAR